MPDIGLTLKGQFKFDLYDSCDNLLYSSDFVDNFITNSGVVYPYYYAFADCFRYLSVGTGSGVNSIINTGGPFPQTTGLQYPLTGSGYSYVGCRSSINPPFTSNYSQPGCGYLETSSGINLFRQWTLPSTTGFFTGYQTLNEFMVTPGQPYVTGLNGQLLCSCDQTDILGNAGNDCSAVSMYYNYVQGLYATVNQFRPTICSATGAFARVIQQINIVPNSYLNITYMLSVNPNTGLNFLQLNNNPGGINPNWTGKLNSISAITQPGICLINDGTINSNGGFSVPLAPNGSPRIQHFNYTGNYDYDFDNEYGESFVPPMGIPLEPSVIQLNNSLYQNLVYYLSNDNTEFLIGPSGNLINTGNYAPWSVGSGVIGVNNSGLAPFLNNNSSIISQSNYWTQNPNTFNIRTSLTPQLYPNTGDITLQNNVSTGYFTSFNISAPQSNFPVLTNGGIRTGQVSYNFIFNNYKGMFNLYVKSFVAGYIETERAVQLEGGDDTNMVPFFDCLFSGTGNVFIPTIITGIMNYGSFNNTGAFISGAADSNYFYLSNGGYYPIFTTILNWSVPCPNGVTGCT